MRVRLLAVATACIAALGAGHGFRNGDAAIYAAQGWSGDLFTRWTHLGWVAVAAAMAPLAGDHLPVALDLVTAVLAGLGVWCAGRIAKGNGQSPFWAALGAAAALLPEAAFAEVDVPWTVALLAAVTARRGVDAAWIGVAILFSPTALLGVPWVVAVSPPEARVRRGAAALVAVAALSVVSGGGWWWGDRGVLAAALSPGKSGLRWVLAASAFAGPLATCARLRPAWAMFGVLAPADVPAWMLAQIAVAVDGRRPTTVRARGLWIASLLAAGLGLALEVRRVHEENVRIREDWAALPSGAPYVARWSDGVRAAVYATRDPYGICWHAPAQAPDRRTPCAGRDR